MNTFNINRFKNTLIWQIANNKKMAINILAFGFLFAVIGGLAGLASAYPNAPTESYAITCDDIFSVISVIYLLTLGTFIVSDISDKVGRISNFILPVSKLEKFISRYVYLLIIVPLLALAGLVVGDLIQMLLNIMVLGDAYSLTRDLFKAGIRLPEVANAYEQFVVLWLIHSIFLLLGTFFRRHAWIKSALLAVSLTIAISLVAFFGTKGILDLIYGEGNYNLLIVDTWWATAIGYIITLAIIVFNYWAAFRIYARMQAVNNKWHNF